MQPSAANTAPMRALLSEAGEARREGDHAAAAAAETDAIRAMRASLAAARPGVTQ